MVIGKGKTVRHTETPTTTILHVFRMPSAQCYKEGYSHIEIYIKEMMTISPDMVILQYNFVQVYLRASTIADQNYSSVDYSMSSLLSDIQDAVTNVC